MARGRGGGRGPGGGRADKRPLSPEGDEEPPAPERPTTWTGSSGARVLIGVSAAQYVEAFPNDPAGWTFLCVIILGIFNVIEMFGEEETSVQRCNDSRESLIRAGWTETATGAWKPTNPKPSARVRGTMTDAFRKLVGAYAACFQTAAADSTDEVLAAAAAAAAARQANGAGPSGFGGGGAGGGGVDGAGVPPGAAAFAGIADFPNAAQMQADERLAQRAREIQEGRGAAGLNRGPAGGVYGQERQGFPLQQEYIPLAGPLHTGAPRLEIGEGGVIRVRQGVGAILNMEALDASWEREVERAEGANDPNLGVLIQFFNYLRKFIFKGVDFRDVLVVDREIRAGWAIHGVSFTRSMVDVALSLHLAIHPRVAPVQPGGGVRDGGRNENRNERDGRGGGRGGGRGAQGNRDRACWKFNSAEGCTRENCLFGHFCSECRNPGHNAINCRRE